MISHSFKTKIYYKDIDQMGIVYYSRYFEFFESARTELLKSIGISVRDIETDNIFLPVVSATCDYRKRAKFEDELIIIAAISEPPSARLNIEYKVLANDKSVLATGKTTHGFINKSGKPKRPPKLLISKIKSLLNNES